MNGQKETELGNSILAIIVGIAATALAGLILTPLEKLVADEYFDLDLGGNRGMSFNDFIFYGSVLIWVFAATFIGGLVCSLICRAYEYAHVLIIAGILLAVLLIIMFNEPASEIPFNFFVIISLSGGLLLGARIGTRYKRKRTAKKTGSLSGD